MKYAFVVTNIEVQDTPTSLTHKMFCDMLGVGWYSRMKDGDSVKRL